MTITFKFSDGIVAEFEIVEDYGMWRYFDLAARVQANPKLGKLKDKEENESNSK